MNISVKIMMNYFLQIYDKFMTIFYLNVYIRLFIKNLNI